MTAAPRPAATGPGGRVTADRPVCYVTPNEATSPRFCEAFARGCGGGVIADGQPREGPIALFGSRYLWPLVTIAVLEERDWYYGDHGYFGRGTYYRVTRNALQADGLGPGDPARLERLGVRVEPWRGQGRHVLVCPPDAIFAALMGISAKAWTEDVLGRLAELTDRPVMVRDRSCGDPGSAAPPLARDLTDCWALVTMMSNAAVEAIRAGVPAICTHPCAALAMGTDDLAAIEDPPTPDGREEWAACLAANQWTLDEIASGLCWRAIGTDD